MRIKEISTWRLKPPKDLQPETEPRRPSWVDRFEIANPMSRYPRYKKRRSSWLPRWGNVWVKVVAEDGTFGLGFTSFDKPVAAIIKEHLAPLLVGEDVEVMLDCYMAFDVEYTHSSGSKA
ncbi:hypothetical protein J7L06_07400 [Candidatus Bathyarchaeota archaeon]|nr:hypothetical protein [Candidatus Bathyarchaeota archaeon]